MRPCRAPLLPCLVMAILPAAPAAFAGGMAAATPPAAPASSRPPARQHRPAPHRFNFAPESLRELVKVKLPASPASLLPAGWEPAASSFYGDEQHPATIDLGLRRQFAGQQSAQLGARFTVLEYFSLDNSGRVALGGRDGRYRGLIGFTYRY